MYMIIDENIIHKKNLYHISLIKKKHEKVPETYQDDLVEQD